MSSKTENSMSDAFEEIEYSSDSTSSSSPASRSSDNADASNQTDQNDTSKQPTELVYQLDWATRDEIILSLGRYTRVIYGEKAETSEKLMHENTDLYQVLISLPQKSSSNAPAGNGHSSKVLLDLNSSARLQIVSTLIANQSLILDADSASEERKMQLVEQNSKLITSLFTLPVCVTTGSASATVSNDHADRLTKRAELAEELAGLKKIIEEHVAKNSELTRKNEEQAIKNSELTKKNQEQATKNSELTKTNEELATKNTELTRTVGGQATQISSLSREIAECKMEVKQIKAGDLNEVVNMLDGKFDLGIGRKKVDFECELDGVGAFLESDKSRFSKYFFAGSLAWHFEFRMTGEGEDRFLSIFLTGTSYAGGSDKWSINVVKKVSILNQSEGQDCSSQNTQDYTSDQPSWGRIKFISASELRTGGYIKSNKIKVQVHLELGELVRTG